MNTRLNITRLMNNICDLDSALDPLNPEYDPYKAEFEYSIIKPILEDLLNEATLKEIQQEQVRFTYSKGMEEDKAESLKSLM